MIHCCVVSGFENKAKRFMLLKHKQNLRISGSVVGDLVILFPEVCMYSTVYIHNIIKPNTNAIY